MESWSKSWGFLITTISLSWEREREYKEELSTLKKWIWKDIWLVKGHRFSFWRLNWEFLGQERKWVRREAKKAKILMHLWERSLCSPLSQSHTTPQPGPSPQTGSGFLEQRVCSPEHFQTYITVHQLTKKQTKKLYNFMNITPKFSIKKRFNNAPNRKKNKKQQLK